MKRSSASAGRYDNVPSVLRFKFVIYVGTEAHMFTNTTILYKKLFIWVTVVFFAMLPCCMERNNNLNVSYFRGQIDILSENESGYLCRFHIYNDLDDNIELRTTGYNVRLASPARIRVTNGNSEQSKFADAPASLHIPAQQSSSFEINIELSTEEKLLFQQGKIIFEYPIVSFRKGHNHYDCNSIVWLPFEVRTARQKL